MTYKGYEIYVEWWKYHAVNYATGHEIHKDIESFDKMKRAIDLFLKQSY